MSPLFLKTKKFVDESFNFTNTKHFKQTIFWIQKLKPDIDEAMLIAAYSHDIERALRKKEYKSIKTFESGKALVRHQKEGGNIMYNFLIKNGSSKTLAKEVKTLISKHEKGGTKQQNILKDADSISYFETNAQRHVGRVNEGYTKHEVKQKFDWMFERITSQKAKKITEPMYNKALKALSKA